MRSLSIDLETYSEVNLLECGGCQDIWKVCEALGLGDLMAKDKVGKGLYY